MTHSFPTRRSSDLVFRVNVLLPHPPKPWRRPCMVHGVGRGGCHAKAWSEQEACASEDGATAGLGKALDQPDHSEGGDGFGAIGSTAALYRPLHHQGFPPVIRTLNSPPERS